MANHSYKVEDKQNNIRIFLYLYFIVKEDSILKSNNDMLESELLK